MRKRKRLIQQVQATNRVAIGYCRCSTEEQSQRTEYNTLQAKASRIPHPPLPAHEAPDREDMHNKGGVHHKGGVHT